MSRKYVKFEIRGNNLIIVPLPEEKEDLADCKDIYEALEYQLCNGWERIAPEECGALTSDDTLIISEEGERDDDGTLTKLGKVYWDADYAVRCALEELQKGNEVTFIGVVD